MTRQLKKFRIWMAVVVLLIITVLALGMTEMYLHSAGFFVFRSQGVGSTPGTGLNEDQGPNQPDSNGAKGCVSNSVGTCLTPEGKTVVHTYPHRGK